LDRGFSQKTQEINGNQFDIQVVPEAETQLKAEDNVESVGNGLMIKPKQRDSTESLTAFGHRYCNGIRELIALFTYKFEANGRSRCQKSANSVVVELNDYEILEITESDHEKYGYHFEVKNVFLPPLGKWHRPLNSHA